MNRDKFTQKVLEAETTLYRVAKSILLNDADCEDAAQEAVLKAYEKIGSLRDERYFTTWLVRILINECYRKKRKSVNIVPIDEYSETLADESGGDWSYLYGAVMSLKPKIRIAVVLHYIEGYSVEETAKMLRIPAGTVKSRLHSGRRILREELGNE